MHLQLRSKRENTCGVPSRSRPMWVMTRANCIEAIGIEMGAN